MARRYSGVVLLTEKCGEGQWVEIHYMVLTPEQRSEDVPSDTKEVPMECWIRGWALKPGKIGDEIQIRTPSNRLVKGTLSNPVPSYSHTFGPSIPELSAIGQELRAMFKEGN